MSAVLGNAVLGIDGGGTRTRASIVDGEQVLAFAEDGSIKRLRVGATAAEANLRALLKDVFEQAGAERGEGGLGGRGEFFDAGREGVDHGGL